MPKALKPSSFPTRCTETRGTSQIRRNSSRSVSFPRTPRDAIRTHTCPSLLDPGTVSVCIPQSWFDHSGPHGSRFLTIMSLRCSVPQTSLLQSWVFYFFSTLLYLIDLKWGSHKVYQFSRAAVPSTTDQVAYTTEIYLLIILEAKSPRWRCHRA